jgi:hypothetical protein
MSLPSALEDVARPEGVAGYGVLDRGNDDAQVHGQFCTHDQRGQAKRGGGTPHVLFHQQHRRRRLDVEAAGVEHDALADERDLGMLRLAPAQIDQPRHPRRRLPHRVHERKVLFQQIVADDGAHRGAEALGESGGGFLDLGGAEIVRRRVDEIAHEKYRFDDAG